MGDLEDYFRACRGHADANYALPDIVDVSQRVIEADFELGRSPEEAVDAIAHHMGLTHRREWSLAKATTLIARIARPVITLKRRSA